MPPSQTALPETLCPPPLTASSRPLSRANATAWMTSATPVQRAMLQLRKHADFKNADDPHDKAKRDAYLHALHVVKLFTGETLPEVSGPDRLGRALAKLEPGTLPGLSLAAAH